MADEFKDHYQVLGLRRTASEEEIRAAFRRLAREHHPDVAEDKKGAEAKFRDIAEANEVLTDPARRGEYDALLKIQDEAAKRRNQRGSEQGPKTGDRSPFIFDFDGLGMDGFVKNMFNKPETAVGLDPDESGPRGDDPDIRAGLTITLEEACQGAVKEVTVRRAVVCPLCAGDGWGDGRECPSCNGEGALRKIETCKVRVPPGVRLGQTLKVPGKGGEHKTGSTPGDLLLSIEFAEHPVFDVNGLDLSCVVEVAPWEAALGGNFSVPTLEGDITVKLPAGTRSGQRMRLRGRGLKAAAEVGDLIVEIVIEMRPPKNDDERALWENFSKEK